MRCWRFCWDYKKIVLTVGLRLFQVLHYVFIPMHFVCRSRLTNTKISIDKRRLSDIFVFAAHSPHRNKNVMFEPKKSSTRDTIFFFSSQMQKIQVTSNFTTVQPLHSLYNNLILSDILQLIFQFSRKSEETLCDSWGFEYVGMCCKKSSGLLFCNDRSGAQTTGVFSAHTATYSTSESTHETQRVSSNLRNPKIGANFYR